MAESPYTADHKVPPFAVTEMTNRDPDFYALIGPLLSRREIVAELGGPMWDDDDKRWWVAHNDEGMLGVVALKGSTICSLYVVPGARGRLVGVTLVVRVTMVASGTLTAVATEASHGLFERCSFVDVGTRGRFYRMEWRAA